MAKPIRGRVAGPHGMESKTAEELHALADRFESEAGLATVSDDPAWLLRWAKRLRRLAEQKERAREHKAGSRRFDAGTSTEPPCPDAP